MCHGRVVAEADLAAEPPPRPCSAQRHPCARARRRRRGTAAREPSLGARTALAREAERWRVAGKPIESDGAGEMPLCFAAVSTASSSSAFTLSSARLQQCDCRGTSALSSIDAAVGTAAVDPSDGLAAVFTVAVR